MKVYEGINVHVVVVPVVIFGEGRRWSPLGSLEQRQDRLMLDHRKGVFTHQEQSGPQVVSEEERAMLGNTHTVSIRICRNYSSNAKTHWTMSSGVQP